MLSVTPSFSQGVLTITGNYENDTIVIRADSNKFVTLNGTPILGGLPAASVASINVLAGGGSDMIDLQGVSRYPFLSLGLTTVDGEAGDDTIYGSPLSDFLKGGPGNDRLFGFDGQDALHGLDGNDQLTGGAHDDYLYGGNGDDAYHFGGAINLGHDIIAETVGQGEGDWLHFTDLGAAVTIDLNSTGKQIVAPGLLSLTLTNSNGIEAVSDTIYSDIIRGNSQNNSIWVGAGNDYIEGRGGNDTYWYAFAVNHGHDTIREDAGGGGRDSVNFGYLDLRDDDSKDGISLDLNGVGLQNVATVSIGGIISNRVQLTLTNPGQVEAAHGSDYDDTIKAANTTYAIYGRGGNDILTGTVGNHSVGLIGGNGNDYLAGTGGNTLSGGAGNDTYHDLSLDGQLAATGTIVDSPTASAFNAPNVFFVNTPATVGFSPVAGGARYSFAKSLDALANSYETAGTSSVASLGFSSDGLKTIWGRVFIPGAGYSTFSRQITALHGGALFVDPNGNNQSGNGSIGRPFATLDAAVRLARPGDTIYVRGGTYNMTRQITIGDADGDHVVRAAWGEIGTDGFQGNPIQLFNFPGETPILDGAVFASQPGNAGLRVNANWWHVRGLTVQHTNYAFVVSGAHNILENCVGRWSTGGGFGISGFYGRPTNDNLFLNCDAYENFDPSLLDPGNNADGFVLGPGVDEGNIFRGCRAWLNSDDAFDLYNAETSITLEDCWAFNNGYNVFGADRYFGGGGGFKLGYDNPDAYPVSHVLIRCVAWGNAAHGFMYFGTTPQVLINCTSYNNGHDNGVEKADQANYVFNNAPSIFRNCISFVSPQLNDVITADANDAYNTFSKVGRESLTAFWKLDDLTDAEGTSNFTINQGVTFAPGKIGNGAVFERANRDYLQTADSAAISMGQGESFTIFARVKLTDKSTFQVFLAKGDPLTTNPAGLEYAIIYDNVVDAIQFRVSNGSTEYVINAGIGSPQVNTWYSLACTFDAPTRELRMHTNASGSAAIVLDGFVQDGTNPLRLGRDATSDHYLNGMVDDVAIFKRVLTYVERMRYWNGGNELPYDVWATAPFGGRQVSERDFLSLDSTIAEGARQADGSLPVSGFLRLAPNSSLIDAGVNVGYGFNGAAPDLGAFESDT